MHNYVDEIRMLDEYLFCFRITVCALYWRRVFDERSACLFFLCFKRGANLSASLWYIYFIINLSIVTVLSEYYCHDGFSDLVLVIHHYYWWLR